MRALLLPLVLVLAAGTAFAHWPYGMVATDDGGAVFLEWPRKRVVRVMPDGTWSVVADLSTPSPEQVPHAIVRGPDGALYVAATYAPKMWRIGAGGTAEAYAPVPMGTPLPSGNWLNIAFGPQSRLHLVLSADERRQGDDRPVPHYRIVRIEKDHTVRELYDARKGDEDYLPLYGSCLAVGPDGTVYLTQGERLFALDGKGRPKAIVPKGLGTAWTVVAEPGGDLLVLDTDGGRLVRVDPDHAVSAVVTGLAHPWSFARSTDGSLVIGEEPIAGEYRLRRFVPGKGLEQLALVKDDEER